MMDHHIQKLKEEGEYEKAVEGIKEIINMIEQVEKHMEGVEERILKLYEEGKIDKKTFYGKLLDTFSIFNILEQTKEETQNYLQEVKKHGSNQ